MMFTLHFPIKLPDEHFFFDDGQYPVPPLPGGLSFGSVHNEHAPTVLQISGFATEQDAVNFCPSLRASIRVASLSSEHSMTPSHADPVRSSQIRFDGSVPTVTATSIKAMPYHVSASMQNGLHISVLSQLVTAALSLGAPNKLNSAPALSLALELYSDCDFAGERNAQFIVLMTALEVLIPKTSKKGKRGLVIGLVKSTLKKAGHSDPKSAIKVLDGLYATRNDLVHEAKPVTDAQLKSLKEIVRATLQGLVA